MATPTLPSRMLEWHARQGARSFRSIPFRALIAGPTIQMPNVNVPWSDKPTIPLIIQNAVFDVGGATIAGDVMLFYSLPTNAEVAIGDVQALEPVPNAADTVPIDMLAVVTPSVAGSFREVVPTHLITPRGVYSNLIPEWAQQLRPPTPESSWSAANASTTSGARTPPSEDTIPIEESQLCAFPRAPSEETRATSVPETSPTPVAQLDPDAERQWNELVDKVRQRREEGSQQRIAEITVLSRNDLPDVQERELQDDRILDAMERGEPFVEVPTSDAEVTVEATHRFIVPPVRDPSAMVAYPRVVVSRRLASQETVASDSPIDSDYVPTAGVEREVAQLRYNPFRYNLRRRPIRRVPFAAQSLYSRDLIELPIETDTPPPLYVPGTRVSSTQPGVDAMELDCEEKEKEVKLAEDPKTEEEARLLTPLEGLEHMGVLTADRPDPIRIMMHHNERRDLMATLETPVIRWTTADRLRVWDACHSVVDAIGRGIDRGEPDVEGETE